MDPLTCFSRFEQKFQTASRSLECVICAESFLLQRERVSVLPCGHSIGELCAKEILGKSCPTCDQPIPHEVSINYDLQCQIDVTIRSLEKTCLKRITAKLPKRHFSNLSAKALYKGIKGANNNEAVQFVFQRWLSAGHRLEQSCGKKMTFLHRAICDQNIVVLRALAEQPGIDALWKVKARNCRTALQLFGAQIQKSQKLYTFFHANAYFSRILVKNDKILRPTSKPNARRERLKKDLKTGKAVDHKTKAKKMRLRNHINISYRRIYG